MKELVDSTSQCVENNGAIVVSKNGKNKDGKYLFTHTIIVISKAYNALIIFIFYFYNAFT